MNLIIFAPVKQKPVEENKPINHVTPEQQAIIEAELFPHLDALYNFAYSLTRNEGEADDLVGETFLRVCRFIDNYRQGTNSKAWLFSILRNLFINEYRRKKVRPQATTIDNGRNGQSADDKGKSGFVDINEELFKKLLGDEVTHALANIPEDARTIIILSDLEDFTYEEIAEILEIPLGTVRSRLFRSRNMLKEKLKEYATKFGIKDKRS